MLLKWRKHRKEQKQANESILRRAGITLVETLVSVTLLMILMAMVVGIVSPAFKVFIRMQKLQFAQMILDNVVEDVQDTVREATTYVKIYESNGGTATSEEDSTGAAKVVSDDKYGSALEYVNTDGYVVLVSSGGCGTTYIYRNNTIESKFDAVDPGQLLFRYYRRVDTSSGSSESGGGDTTTGGNGSGEGDTSSGDNESGGGITPSGDDESSGGDTLSGNDETGGSDTPSSSEDSNGNDNTSDSGDSNDSDNTAEDNTTKNQYYYSTWNGSAQYPIARAATTAFGSGYYMGNYLKIEFSFPDGVGNGEKVKRLTATASLYADSAMTDLVVSEEFIVDLRYDVVREDGETAIVDGSESSGSSMTWGITLSGN